MSIAHGLPSRGARDRSSPEPAAAAETADAAEPESASGRLGRATEPRPAEPGDADVRPRRTAPTTRRSSLRRRRSPSRRGAEASEAAQAERGRDRRKPPSSAEPIPEQPPPETVGGERTTRDEARERRIPPRFLRNYKIQEVIKRRQILLVQVVKEERGTKGAALTTYLSLAGRYCVLMPNSPRGGGISRKITSAADRRRLKEIMAELDIPQGDGPDRPHRRRQPAEARDQARLRIPAAAVGRHPRAHAEIDRAGADLRGSQPDQARRSATSIRATSTRSWSTARRAGSAAHEFMRMLMPSHAKKVQLWRERRHAAVRQASRSRRSSTRCCMPTVQLRSGGYLVINQTEALVAIDVNSGRSTRERNIEETALRTNLEAADEVARQLRLRDLAGLIVIDFIDMESDASTTRWSSGG